MDQDLERQWTNPTRLGDNGYQQITARAQKEFNN